MVLWETEIALKIPFLMTTKAMFNTIEIKPFTEIGCRVAFWALRIYNKNSTFYFLFALKPLDGRNCNQRKAKYP